jgi:hypothetical protein
MSIIILSLDYMNFNVCLLLKNTTTILYNHTINTFGAFLLVLIKIYLKKKKKQWKTSTWISTSQHYYKTCPHSTMHYIHILPFPFNVGQNVNATRNQMETCFVIMQEIWFINIKTFFCHWIFEFHNSYKITLIKSDVLHLKIEDMEVNLATMLSWYVQVDPICLAGDRETYLSLVLIF